MSELINTLTRKLEVTQSSFALNSISLLETDNIPINNVNIAITWPASHFTSEDREVNLQLTDFI